MDAAHAVSKVAFAWAPGDWIAFGMLLLTVILALVGGVVALVKFSHSLGKHDQRLITAEREIKDLKAADRSADLDRTELAVLKALMERIEGSVRDMGSGLTRRMEGIETDIRRYLARREDI